ncbi:hypothetical protein [Microbacterium sp. USHLN186]|uniref:hypothetical protein n=1 Tax=Microbacterium sp. USHLN186 TaxID=3081286 RepID=UPI003016B443
MRRTLRTLLIAGIAGVALAGCAPAAPTASESPAVVSSSATASPSASASASAETEQTGAPTAPISAEQLCAEQSVADEDDVCVLEGASVTGDLSFTGFQVVKLIGVTVDGSVTVDAGAQQVVVTDSTVTGDVTATARGGVVVKLSTIGGALEIAGGRNATLVKNTVGGDLRCADGVQANGDGNTVTGTVTGTCARVV